MPYPGPFLEPGLEKRIKRTAFLRSLVRPDKRAYRAAAKEASGEALIYAQDNCTKYFSFQFTWVEIMQRMESDRGLQQALVKAAIARQAGEEVVVEEATSTSTYFDPGLTGEIQLNIADNE